MASMTLTTLPVERESPPQMAAGGKAANEDAVIIGVAIHADPVTKDRAAGKWTGGIDGDNPDPLAVLAVDEQSIDPQGWIYPAPGGPVKPMI